MPNMNMNNPEELRNLVNRVLNNEEACELLRKLLLPNTAPAAPASGPVWYVWCVDLVNKTDGKTYYHPVVTSADMMPSLDAMMDVDNYIMLADQNQFAVRQWEPMMRMTGQHVMVVSIPDETYQALNTALKSLVAKILAEAEKMFEPLDNIAVLTRGQANGEQMKLMMLMRIFADMRVLFECVDQNMDIHDSSDHDYEEEDEECDGDCCHCGCGCGEAEYDEYDDDYCPCDNCQLDSCDECPHGSLCD